MDFLLTWKEGGWPWPEMQALLRRFEKNGSADETWRFRSHTKVKVGDDVFLYKQGKERGLMGFGKVIGPPKPADRRWGVPVRFSLLVNPREELLIPEDATLETGIPKTILETQSSGIAIPPDAAAKLRAMLEKGERHPLAGGGTAWSDAEVRAAVDDYFEMLQEESSGRPYNKAKHNADLRTKLNGRSAGSVELKHQNISAVLNEAGLPYITGYKPRGNYQQLLRTVVLERVSNVPGRLDAIVANLERAAAPASIPTRWVDAVVEPPARENDRPNRDKRLRVPVKRDMAQRDERNRELGERGEEWVLAMEKDRLIKEGRPELAAKVEWTARELGDGAGYDIKSFEKDGSPRYIEVKTTNGGANAPFLVSRNELEFSKEVGRQFHLYRVFSFRSRPQLYVLCGTLEKAVDLEPSQFLARPDVKGT